MKGIDPYAEFWSSGDTLSNIGKDESFTHGKEDLSWGTVSGHNSYRVETLAERFVVAGKKYLLGVSAAIEKSYAATDTGFVTLCLWNDMDPHHAPDIQEIVPVIDFAGGTNTFIEFDSTVAVTDSFLIGFRLSYNLPQDTFSLYHVERDIHDLNTAFIRRNEKWIPMNDTGAYDISVSLALSPVLYDSVPQKSGSDIPYMEDSLLVYPNPAGEGLWIAFKSSPAGEVTVKLFDAVGHAVFVKTFPEVPNPFYVSWDMPLQGVYLMQVITGNHTENQRILLFKR
jgi:hypothetical protein